MTSLDVIFFSEAHAIATQGCPFTVCLCLGLVNCLSYNQGFSFLSFHITHVLCTEGYKAVKQPSQDAHFHQSKHMGCHQSN